MNGCLVQGGVWVYGSFQMNDGSVKGGVHLENGAEFIMEGGTVEGRGEMQGRSVETEVSSAALSATVGGDCLTPHILLEGGTIDTGRGKGIMLSGGAEAYVCSAMEIRGEVVVLTKDMSEDSQYLDATRYEEVEGTEPVELELNGYSLLLGALYVGNDYNLKIVDSTNSAQLLLSVGDTALENNGGTLRLENLLICEYQAEETETENEAVISIYGGALEVKDCDIRNLVAVSGQDCEISIDNSTIQYEGINAAVSVIAYYGEFSLSIAGSQITSYACPAVGVAGEGDLSLNKSELYTEAETGTIYVMDQMDRYADSVGPAYIGVSGGIIENAGDGAAIYWEDTDGNELFENSVSLWHSLAGDAYGNDPVARTATDNVLSIGGEVYLGYYNEYHLDGYYYISNKYELGPAMLLSLEEEEPATSSEAAPATPPVAELEDEPETDAEEDSDSKATPPEADAPAFSESDTDDDSQDDEVTKEENPDAIKPEEETGDGSGNQPEDENGDNGEDQPEDAEDIPEDTEDDSAFGDDVSGDDEAVFGEEDGDDIVADDSVSQDNASEEDITEDDTSEEDNEEEETDTTEGNGESEDSPESSGEDEDVPGDDLPDAAPAEPKNDGTTGTTTEKSTEEEDETV